LKLCFNTLKLPTHIADDINPIGLKNADLFDVIMQMRGEIFRQMPGRCTSKIRIGEQYYFLKQHFGVGWKEIFKNLITFKLPIIGGHTEMIAIEALQSIGIQTTPFVAFGERGLNPATKKSFLITKDLGDIISLEDVCADWLHKPPSLQFKRQLIRKVAHMAGNMHANGLNHRDFYICHICLHKSAFAAQDFQLFLIDLHRMGVRKKISNTHRLKDLAALHFSSLHCGLSKKDYACFLSIYQSYCNAPLSNDFWQKVNARAQHLNARQIKYADRKW
jgi:heptose I phosphotransferase